MENCHRQPCRQRSWEGGDEKIKMQEDCFCIWRDRAPENKATKSNPERRAANSKHSGVSTCSHPEAGWASGGISVIRQEVTLGIAGTVRNAMFS